MHLLACGGMDETDGLCLEIETVCLCAIEFIANDWTAKTVWVGAVHSKLVCTSGVGPKSEERPTPSPSPREGSLVTLHADVLNSRSI